MKFNGPDQIAPSRIALTVIVPDACEAKLKVNVVVPPGARFWEGEGKIPDNVALGGPPKL